MLATKLVHLRQATEPGQLLKRFGELLSVLRWRLRSQDIYLFVLHLLLQDELIEEYALVKPMNILRENDAVN
jgi:hypothetical protein